MSLYIYTDVPELKQLLIEQTQKHRMTDSGFDIPLAYGFCVGRQTSYNCTVNLHVKVAAVDDQTTRPCLLLPRSSIGKTAFRLANSIGLIDQGYRGEVQAKVDIVNPSVGDLSVGDRLFQICRHDFLPWNAIVVVDNLEDLPAAPDNRGDGGFGSTGR